MVLKIVIDWYIEVAMSLPSSTQSTAGTSMENGDIRSGRVRDWLKVWYLVGKNDSVSWENISLFYDGEFLFASSLSWTQVQYQGTYQSMVIKTVSKKGHSRLVITLYWVVCLSSNRSWHLKLDTIAVMMSVNDDDGVIFATILIFGYFEVQTLPFGSGFWRWNRVELGRVLVPALAQNMKKKAI